MKLSDSQESLVDRYFEIRNDYDKIRGLKRAITLYCNSHHNPDYARRSLKR